MNRRSAPVVGLALLIVTLVAGLTLLAPLQAPAALAGAAASTDEPVTTANPFYPEERDLTDCVGLVERPGCGAESRGGLHQNLVAIVMVTGLLIIFGRVAWVVRRSQQHHADQR